MDSYAEICSYSKGEKEKFLLCAYGWLPQLTFNVRKKGTVHQCIKLDAHNPLLHAV